MIALSDALAADALLGRPRRDPDARGHRAEVPEDDDAGRYGWRRWNSSSRCCNQWLAARQGEIAGAKSSATMFEDMVARSEKPWLIGRDPPRGASHEGLVGGLAVDSAITRGSIRRRNDEGS